jgi:hypothetical protein
LDREVRKRAEEKRAACLPHTAEPYWPTFDLRLASVDTVFHSSYTQLKAAQQPAPRQWNDVLRRL